jgi:hypothetical protein
MFGRIDEINNFSVAEGGVVPTGRTKNLRGSLDPIETSDRRSRPDRAGNIRANRFEISRTCRKVRFLSHTGESISEIIAAA